MRLLLLRPGVSRWDHTVRTFVARLAASLAAVSLLIIAVDDIHDPPPALAAGESVTQAAVGGDTVVTLADDEGILQVEILNASSGQTEVLLEIADCPAAQNFTLGAAAVHGGHDHIVSWTDCAENSHVLNTNNESTARGLFAKGKKDNSTGPVSAKSWQNDVRHLAEVIDPDGQAFGTNWKSVKVFQDANRSFRLAEIATAATAAFAGADDDDVSVFVYSGYGYKEEDDDSDDLAGDVTPISRCRQKDVECDEGIAALELITDDELGAGAFKNALSAVRGVKVIVFSSCFSGGLIDGNGDLDVPNSFVITACTTNERAWAGDYFGADHPHTRLVGSLIGGLLDEFEPAHDPPEPPAGVAPADTDATKGQVTLQEWYDFAEREVAAIVSENAQTPKLTSFSTTAASDVVFFEYTVDDLSGHEHNYKESYVEEGQCLCDDGLCAWGGVAEAISADEAPASTENHSTRAYTLAAVVAAGAGIGFAAVGLAIWKRQRPGELTKPHP